jgi:endoglycosylceramidase
VFDFGADSSHGDTGDAQAGFAFNMYCLAGGFLPANPVGDLSCGETYELTLQNAESQSEQTGDALLMTEYGATNDLGVIEEIVGLSDEHMMSWQQWHYCECDDPTTAGGGVQSVVTDPREPPRGDNVNRGKLKVTARPYPRLVSGTPTAWSFDRASRRFELSYSTTTPGGRRLRRRALTEVFVPRIHYRDGYKVKLTGARRVSKRNAKVLKLKRRPRAQQVSVVVTAR